jgi:mono/diheme cytochrome c family protein
MKGPIEVKGEAYNSEMPQHSFLNDDQIAKVLTYVRSSFGNTASAVSAEEVAKVRAMKVE